jgi:N-acetyl-anhydromuramoyl-L-alanine amidase
MSSSHLLKNKQLNIINGWVDKARHVKSPNFNQRPKHTLVDAIIIHGISLPAGKFGGHFIDDLFTNQLDLTQHSTFIQLKNVKVSSHFLIRRDGELVQYVNVHERAWHAGKSELEGKKYCNNFSIGIELEGTDDIAYEDNQYQQLVNLVHCLKDVFPKISNQRIVGHSDIAPGRKTDPGDAFLWDEFLEKIEI